MTYTLAPVSYADAPQLAETMMRAMNEDNHYSLILRHTPTDQIIQDMGLRLPYNLSQNRHKLRHQKVVHCETGMIVGYARWEIPDIATKAEAWLEMQMPAPTNGQEEEFKRKFDLTMEGGKRRILNSEMAAFIGEELGRVYDELLEGGGPYLVLDYMVCHPAHYRNGVASMLLAQGEVEARSLGVKILVMTSTHPAGRRFYEKNGFRCLRTVAQDDSKWGGVTPHVTSFLEKDV